MNKRQIKNKCITVGSFILPTVYALNKNSWKRLWVILNLKFNHTPVMLIEAIRGLDIKEDGIYVDGTLRWGWA